MNHMLWYYVLLCLSTNLERLTNKRNIMRRPLTHFHLEVYQFSNIYSFVTQDKLLVASYQCITKEGGAVLNSNATFQISLREPLNIDAQNERQALLNSLQTATLQHTQHLSDVPLLVRSTNNKKCFWYSYDKNLIVGNSIKRWWCIYKMRCAASVDVTLKCAASCHRLKLLSTSQISS